MAVSKERLLLTTNQAAEALSISPRKLWSLTQAREIRCIRIGRSVRYSVDDLRQWIAQQAEGGQQ